MSDGQGIASAAQQVQAMGRGPDTLLAHISPDEAQFIDHLQGGRRTNPMTGLPEYGLFGNILKAVARVAGAVGGFMVGGPLGAAAGSGAMTKLTGGSWNDALKAGALSGVGAGVAGGITGAGSGLTSAGSTIGTTAGTGAATIGASAPALSAGTINGISVGASQLPQAAAAALPGSVAPSVGLSALQHVATSTPGIVAGLGALSTPLSNPQSAGLPAGTPSPIHVNDVIPLHRQQIPYGGDYAHYGEPGGGGQHVFFDNVNPMPEYSTKKDPNSFADGGPVAGPMAPDLGMRGLRGGALQMQQTGVNMHAPGGGAAINGPGSHALDLRRAALLGFQSASGMPGMARGGAVPSPAAQVGVIHGPGGPTDDLIPAHLSDGEHVFDSRTVSLAGRGNNDKGQKVIEGLKQEIRRQGGATNVKKPPTAMMIARAKKRAGVK